MSADLAFGEVGGCVASLTVEREVVFFLHTN